MAARPKALIDDGHCKWIAKFSSTTDYYPVVKSASTQQCVWQVNAVHSSFPCLFLLMFRERLVFIFDDCTRSFQVLSIADLVGEEADL